MSVEGELGHEPASSSSTLKPPQDPDEKLEVVTIPVGMPTGGMLRNLQKGGMPAMRSIMEIHRRHYHMPIREVQAVLKRAGIDPTTIDEVPKVIKTCKACQDWQELPPKANVNLTTAEGCNDEVWCDLAFIDCDAPVSVAAVFCRFVDELKKKTHQIRFWETS